MTAVALVSLLIATAAAAPPPPPDPTAGLTDRQLSGQRVIAGFHGTTAPRALIRRIHRDELAGVIVFARNIQSRPQLRRLTSRLQRARPPHAPPLIVSIDQEGGLVKRLGGAPSESAAQMGARNSAAHARRQGRATARNLRAVGINVDFAPVLDVARRGGAIDRQERSFGRRASRVARIGGAFASGLEAGGVAGTGKHFPGLGAARADQDLEANRIDLSLRRLRATDERPFRAQTRLPLVMLSSATYPALSEQPAVFSKKVATSELREHAGFKGVAITDALDAPAMARYGPLQRRVDRAAAAGVDIMLFAEPTTAAPKPARAPVRRILALRESLRPQR